MWDYFVLLLIIFLKERKKYIYIKERKKERWGCKYVYLYFRLKNYVFE